MEPTVSRHTSTQGATCTAQEVGGSVTKSVDAYPTGSRVVLSACNCVANLLRSSAFRVVTGSAPTRRACNSERYCGAGALGRSEERRVGNEWRSWWAPYH